jgi:lactoylglutathione lyase
MGGGLRQHRHEMNGSVFKLNDARDPLKRGEATGYRELLVARDGLTVPQQFSDPDGNIVTLVPRGRDGISGIAVRLGVRDEAAHHAFYRDALQLEQIGERAYRCGDTILRFAASARAKEVGAMTALGFRYLTIQVKDVDMEHAGIVARGGAEGRPPITLGSTARISFVRDPDGNWIEISQRASLTGPLPAA